MGIPIYIWSRMRNPAPGPNREPLFQRYEKVILGLLVLVALCALSLFARGIMKV